MDGQLTQVYCPESPSTGWVTLLGDLRRDMAALCDRVHHLERENLELRQQVGYWKSRHRDAVGYSGPRKLDQRLSYTGGPAKGVRWQASGRSTHRRSRPRSPWPPTRGTAPS